VNPSGSTGEAPHPRDRHRFGYVDLIILDERTRSIAADRGRRQRLLAVGERGEASRRGIRAEGRRVARAGAARWVSLSGLGANEAATWEGTLRTSHQRSCASDQTDET
jgi:hypothetical protein